MDSIISGLIFRACYSLWVVHRNVWPNFWNQISVTLRVREFRAELKKNDHVIAELRNHCYFHLQNICKKGQNCRITIVQWLESGIDYQSATSNDYHFSGGKIISSAQSMSVYYRDLKVDFSNKTFLCSNRISQNLLFYDS